MTHRELSYLWPGLKPEHRKMLQRVPSGATLKEEMALLRTRIRKVVEGYGDCSPAQTDELKRQEKVDRQLLRMLELLTRMVNVQARVADEKEEGLSDVAEVVRQRLEKAGLSRRQVEPANPAGLGE